MQASSEWCTIESDPGVFTELVEKVGVKGVQVQELFTLDDTQNLNPVYGLIFLFKWHDKIQPRECLENYPETLFFARQVLVNSCATQALLSILLNREEIDVGEHLDDLRAFTVGMEPKQKGETIGNSEVLRIAHNSFAKQEYFHISQKRAATKDDDVYHFISYVPHEGALYQLDGLQPGPILLADIQGKDWIALAREAIQARIEKYATEEIRFNLLAVVGNQKERYEKQESRAKAYIAEIAARLGEANPQGSNYVLSEEELNQIPQDAQELAALVTEWEQQLNYWSTMKIQEEQKRIKWKNENERRRHNYIPLAMGLLKAFAEKGKLQEMLDKAVEEKKKKQEQKRQQKKEQKA